MTVAYILNSYPMTSTTFIRREILALERQGVRILRIALRTWSGELVEDDDKTERERTQYILHGGWPPLLLALLLTLLSRPARFARALMLAVKMGWRADRPLPIHLVYLAEACRIEPMLRAAGVQHVHAHFGTNTAEVAMLVRALGGPPWSFTVHGPEEFDKAPLLGLADKVRDANFVVAVSSYGRSQIFRLVEQEHWPKIEIVHCGLDRDFADMPASPPSSPRRLICVGRLCEQKGQLLLVEAARRLAAEGVDFELVLAGDGENRDEIEALLRQHDLTARVRITGWISGAHVKEQILAARAMVLPSFAEGLPVVLMEAMALRRPVISTYIAGIPELVSPGEHGWLVPAGDVEALVEAMRTCLAAPDDQLVRMGEAARKRALARHDINTEAKKLMALFNDSMNSPQLKT